MPNIRKRQDYALWLSMIKEADRFMCLSEILMYKRLVMIQFQITSLVYLNITSKF